METSKNILILFQEIHEGNQEAFNTVFKLYYKTLLQWCVHHIRNKEAAEEIVADVFVKLWKCRHSLHNVQNPDVYLFTAVRNQSLNYLRDYSKSKVVYLEDALNEAILHWDDPEKELETKELHHKFLQAVEVLPEQSKVIFKLVREEGLKCREVAQILQLSIRTVENQVFRTIRKLDEILNPFLEKKLVKKKSN